VGERPHGLTDTRNWNFNMDAQLTGEYERASATIVPFAHRVRAATTAVRQRRASRSGAYNNDLQPATAT
jgi:hypothetical protein